MTPMPLHIAVKECFPHGGATVNTLRAAIRSGDLQAELIGRQYMVTALDIENWRDKCRGRARGRGSTSSGSRVDRPSMSSATEQRRLAQDALSMMLMGPTKFSGTTSPEPTGRTPMSAAYPPSRARTY
jgi:hypothetical protein